MKKRMLGLLLVALIVAGCSKNGEKADKQSESSSSGSTVASRTIGSTPAASDQNTAESARQEEAEPAFPYQVDPAVLAAGQTFYYHGTNVPTYVTLTTAGINGTARFVYESPDGSMADSVSEYEITVQDIPTKEIRVAGAADNAIRTVEVNTEVILGSVLIDDGREDKGTLYLFMNSNGGLSLATPNYAGNAPDDQSDVLLEVLTY